MAEKTSVPEPNSEINKLVYVIRDDGSYGGWRTELLVEEMTGKVEERFLLCNHCRGVLRDACLFEKDGKHGVACSLCIPKYIHKDIAQLNRETVNEKQVYCPLNEKGCDWTNELSELLHHLEECELFPVTCPLGCRDVRGEVSRVERRRVETHRTCCPMRTVKCEYCSVSVKAGDMNGHLEECEEFPILCPNKCSEEFRVKRKEKSIHLSQECPLQKTECPYSQYGCEVKVQRRNLEQHEKEDMHKHMKITVNNMQCEVSEQKKENEKFKNKIDTLENESAELRKQDFKLQLLLKGEEETINLHKIRIKNMQSKIVKLEKENEVFRSSITRGSFEWKISGIQGKIAKDIKSYSVPFYIGLYLFQGFVKWDQADCYVGVFLYIMKGERDTTLKWPIKYRYSILLINQLDAKNNYQVNEEITDETLKKFPMCFRRPITTGKNDGFGPVKFISHADLLQKYSKNDEMALKISVELILDI